VESSVLIFYITPFADVLSTIPFFSSETITAWKPWLNFDLKDAILRPIYVFATVALIGLVVTTVLKSQKKLHALAQFTPHVFTLITMMIWKTMPVFHDRAAWIMLVCGLINSLSTSRVIICSLTKMKSPVFQWEYIVNLVAVLIVKFVNASSIEFTTQVLIGLSIYVTISACLWTSGCVDQISSYLGIYCFSLEKRARAKLE